MAKYPCRGCVYFKACGDNMRTMPCEGRATKTTRGMKMLLLFALCIIFSAETASAQTLIDVKPEENEDYATAIVYSTEKQWEDTYYNLYIVEKKDGKWENKELIRQIKFPKADIKRKGKYTYYSKSETVDWLKSKKVYRLSPVRSDGYNSKLFWRKPIV